MIQRLRKRQGGFTLIELLIVVAIIGIIAALLIPNFLDALQKAKQKRAVADARNVGTAQMSWLTDQSQAGAAGATGTYSLGNLNVVTYTQWESILVDQYIQDIPQFDPWKNEYVYYENTNSAAGFGAKQLFATVSFGADGVVGAATGAITTSAFDPTDYDQDIVWADGFFVRWPQKLSAYN
ncbi:MAG: prepilin-type N-terminal cleavage/methylation domain-containing protein [Thermoanaerobaculia bacterium]|nr:prepilin-type N-terminal cleavage/methylation domain-containing protein [Thermoanaerobaculia bacterium]